VLTRTTAVEHADTQSLHRVFRIQESEDRIQKAWARSERERARCNPRYKISDSRLRTWTARHGEAEEWWRADPTVEAVIEKNGVLGIPGLKPE